MAALRHLGPVFLLLAGLPAFGEETEARFRAVLAMPATAPEQEGEVLGVLARMPENPSLFRLWQAGAESRGEARFAAMVERFAREALGGETLPDPPADDGVESAEFLLACEALEACATPECLRQGAATLRRILESPPHAAREAIELASLYRTLGERLPAAVSARHAMRAGTTNDTIRAAYFDDLHALGLREVELREWERWTDPDRAPPARLEAMARRMLDLGAAHQAQAWVHRWVRREPENGEAWLWSGRTALANQDPDGAERDFAQALRKLADPLPAWQELARLRANKRDIEQTKIWLRKIQARLSEEDWMDFLMDPAFGRIPELMLDF